MIKSYKRIIQLSNLRTSKSLQITSDAYIVFKALHGNNINFIPLKGLQLIYFYKKNLAYRSIRDIDLLVKEEDIAQTVSVLKNIGFYFKSNWTVKINRKFSKNNTTYDIEPMFNENGVCIEIHYKIFKEVNCSLSNQMWSQINTYQIGEMKLNKLSVEILALHIIYHASSKQGFDVGVQALFDIHFLFVSDNFYHKNFFKLYIKHNLHSEVSIFLSIYEKYQSIYIEEGLKKELLDFDEVYLDQCTYLLFNSKATNQSVKLFRNRFSELILNNFNKKNSIEKLSIWKVTTNILEYFLAGF